MNMQRGALTSSKRISLAAMLAAFTLLFLYIAAIIPAGRLAMYFLSSMFVAGLVVERETGLAFLMFVAVSLLSLLVIHPLTRVFYYIVFFGHYGIGKHYIERMRDKVMAFILKLLYFNAAVALMYFIASGVLLADVSLPLPIWALILIAQPLFIVYDYLYSLVTQFYFQKIRRWLIRPTRD